jgi:ribosomal protein S1
MENQFWNNIKSQYQLGKLIYGQVEAHKPFGVFVDIGNTEVRGIIQITDFLDTGVMTPEMYPEIGSPVGAVVVGYTEDERNQIWLSVKPSILQKSLVKLNIPTTNEAIANKT